MTLRVNKERDAASLDLETNAAQLPAYVETDGQSHGSVEKADAPRSPAAYTYMSAEEEKAHLAGRAQSEDQDHQQFRPPSTPPGTYRSHPVKEGSIQTLARGLQVPPCNRKVSSGFPYPEVLDAHGVSREEWSRFASEITQAAQLSSKDWSITVGAGVATLFTSGLVIGWFGLIPALLVGQHLRRSAENRNLRAAKDTGDLEVKLLRWNESTFAPKGFLVRLDLPGDDLTDLDRMDVYIPKKWGRKCGGARRGHNEAWVNGGGCAQKTEKRARFLKKKIARKGRIVIIPLNGIDSPPSENRGQFEYTNQVPISEKGLYPAAVREV